MTAVSTVKTQRRCIYGIKSSASKTCFVTAMFAHMLRLIIHNHFHLLLKYFSIRNSLSNLPSAPLLADVVSIFVASMRR